MPADKPKLCFIGFGEAGQAMAAGLREAGVERHCRMGHSFPGGGRRKAAARRRKHRRALASSAADAVRGADMVISAVTAASSLEAAQSVKAHLARPAVLPRHQFGLARPQAGNRQDARRRRTLCRRRGARTDLSGTASDADAARRSACRGDRAACSRRSACAHSVAGAEVGAAAAIKMVRSVMIKGIEALTLECFLAAARAGVIDEVAASMKNNYPGLDWAKIVPYNLERMASHGERRAAEMEEVADTLRELGVEPLMTAATVKRQREMGRSASSRPCAARSTKDRAAMLERDQRRRARPALIVQKQSPGCSAHERLAFRRFQIGSFDDLGPLLRLFGEVISVIAGRHGRRHGAESGKLGLYLRVRDGRCHFLVQYVDDRRRHAFWRRKAFGDACLVTRQKISDCRQIGESLGAQPQMSPPGRAACRP